MESLAYIHQAIAYTDPNPAPIVTLWQRFNGQKRPTSGWLKLLGISIIVAAAISLSEAAHAATVKITTNSGDGVNVRVQPSTDSTKIGGLQEGAIVEVADSNTSGWYIITAGNYKNAYIDSQWTFPIAANVATNVATSSDNSTVAGSSGKMRVKTNTGLGLNIRSLPSTNSPIVGGLKEGEEITATRSDTPGWSKITEGNFAGSYVDNSWLVSVGGTGTGGNDSPPSKDANTNTNPEKRYVIKTKSGNGLQVRALPANNSQRIGGLDDGAKVTAKESGTLGWLQITTGDFRGGYIASDYAFITEDSGTNSSSSSGSGASYRVKTNSGIGLTVRSSPVIGDNEIGSLPEGEVVTVAIYNSQWLQIVAGPKAGGYIFREWAIPTSAIRSSNQSTGNYVVRTNKNELVVRSAPRKTASAIGGLTRGQRIAAVPSSTPGWLKITEGLYAGGFISDDWVVPNS